MNQFLEGHETLVYLKGISILNSFTATHQFELVFLNLSQIFQAYMSLLVNLTEYLMYKIITLPQKVCQKIKEITFSVFRRPTLA